MGRGSSSSIYQERGYDKVGLATLRLGPRRMCVTGRDTSVTTTKRFILRISHDSAAPLDGLQDKMGRLLDGGM